MAGALYIDGVDVSTTHQIWISGEPREWLSTPAANFPVSRLSGRVGGIISEEFDVEPRRLSIPIRVLGTTPTTRRTSEQYLKGKFGRQVLIKIDADDGAVRQIRGVLNGVALDPLKRVITQTAYGAISVLCGDPCWQEVSATDLALTDGVAASIGLGTAPVSDWSLALTGSVTDLTITITDEDDNALWVMTWTGTMTSETLTIDSANGLVMLDAVNEFANYTGGFPELDPRVGPKIKIEAASGTVAGVLSLRKRDW